MMEIRVQGAENIGRVNLYRSNGRVNCVKSEQLDCDHEIATNIIYANIITGCDSCTVQIKSNADLRAASIGRLLFYIYRGIANHFYRDARAITRNSMTQITGLR